MGDGPRGAKNEIPSLTFGVRGRNVAFFERPQSCDPRSSSSSKKYFRSALECNEPKIKAKKLVRNKANVAVRGRKKTIEPRSIFNIPVKSLADSALRDQNSSITCLRSCNVHGRADDGNHRGCYKDNVCCRGLCNARPLHVQNKTLAQIREADKVSDFERILNSNAILFGATHSHVRAVPAEMFSDVFTNDGAAPLRNARPLSSYSLLNISETYDFLFQRHLDSLKATPDRKLSVELEDLDERLYEELYNLPEYYDEDYLTLDALGCAVSNAGVVADDTHGNCTNNFNVNLSDLISADKYDRATDDGGREGAETPSERIVDTAADASRWKKPIMSSTDREEAIGDLERSLCELSLEQESRVPTITLSECENSSGASRVSPRRSDGGSFGLTVPSMDCDIAESRPPLGD